MKRQVLSILVVTAFVTGALAGCGTETKQTESLPETAENVQEECQSETSIRGESVTESMVNAIETGSDTSGAVH